MIETDCGLHSPRELALVLCTCTGTEMPTGQLESDLEAVRAVEKSKEKS
jgi:hypothetical protein